MSQEINISEARAQFPALVQQVESEPDARYRILVRERRVAELRSPEATDGPVTGIAALLRLADEIAKHGVKNRKRPPVTSRNYKEFLYGHWPPRKSRRGR